MSQYLILCIYGFYIAPLRGAKIRFHIFFYEHLTPSGPSINIKKLSSFSHLLYSMASGIFIIIYLCC
jgi:hypothetical protein